MIHGTEISSINPYNGDSYLYVHIGNDTYRISCTTILQMVNEFDFDTDKKRVHTHLVNPKLRGDIQ